MKKTLLFILLFCFLKQAYCQIQRLVLLPTPDGTIAVEVDCDFSPGPDYCAPMLGYKFYKKSDTLFVRAYYRQEHLSTHFRLGCTTRDTIRLGNWAYHKNVMAINVLAFKSEMQEDLELDTFAMPPSKSIHRSLSVSSIDKQSSIKVFPNPATLLLSISSEHPIHSAIIQNIQGMVLPKKQENIESIDIAGLSPGIYFLKLETSEGVFVKQFLKE